MTLLQKLNSIINKINDAKTSITTALFNKGVVQLEDYKISDVPALINKIFQSDFEFFFNFKEIDQFGNPHMRKSGQAIGGLTDLGITCEDFCEAPKLDLSDVNNIDLMHKPIGPFGIWIGSNNGIEIASEEFAISRLLNFKENNVISEELHYDDSFVG